MTTYQTVTGQRTGLDFISSALRLIGAQDPNEPVSPGDAATGLQVLNDMVDAWQAERLMIYTVGPQTFALTVGKQTYTMGPGGDFDTDRPPSIERVSIIFLGNPAQPLELEIDYLTDAQWQHVPVKNISSALPTEVWDDQNFPLRGLNFWPIPSANVKTSIYTWSVLSQFGSLADQHNFPPAYARAIRFNLAVDLAAEYGKSVSPEVAMGAMTSKAVVQSLNAPTVDLRCDAALTESGRSLYNWISDTPVRR
jgi:hypothetical protein